MKKYSLDNFIRIRVTNDDLEPFVFCFEIGSICHINCFQISSGNFLCMSKSLFFQLLNSSKSKSNLIFINRVYSCKLIMIIIWPAGRPKCSKFFDDYEIPDFSQQCSKSFRLCALIIVARSSDETNQSI